VVKKSNADVLRTIDQVKETVAQFQKKAGDALRVDYIDDFSVGTRSILKIVIANALLGMILVVATLLVFLNFRTAFWTAMGIPLALCLALFVMVLSDLSLNGNSLLGMVIVLGMLVDDAIVVAESIYRYRLEGLSAYEAAKKGLKVVVAPVFVTVTTTIIAFAPLFFLPGIPGKFVLPIPLVITYALLASLFEAYFILPNHLTGHTLQKATPDASEKLADRKWFKNLQAGYLRLLNLALHHRVILIGIFIALFVGSLFYAAVKMKFVLFPQTTIETSTWYLEAQRDTSLEKMDGLTRQLEAILARQPQNAILSYSTRIGRGRWDMPENENVATLVVNYPPAAEQKYDPGKIVAELEKILNHMPEMQEWRHEVARGGPPVGGDVEIDFIGNDNQRRSELVKKVAQFLRGLEGVTDVESSEKAGKPEMALEFDFRRLARYGLNAADVGLAVRTALEGTIVSRTYTPEERIDYRVLLQKKDRESLDTIKRLYVYNAQRVLVPITHVVRFKERTTMVKIEHLNGDRFTKITANLDKKKITPLEAVGRLNAYLPGIMREYPGFRFQLGGEAKESQAFFTEVAVAFVIAVLAIYFILSLLFNSFLQPFIVMITIPFGIVGVIWTFAIHGLEFSFLTLIGIVGLSGIVVNDSLIMVDYINRLVREKGCRNFQDYLDAAMQGAKTRLRPIILTTLTTAAGVMPTAYGLGGYIESLAPMVLAIGWGITFASTLTLFLVPGLYVLEVQFEMLLTRLIPALPLKTQCAMPLSLLENNARPLVRKRKQHK
ncbi:efflux RND transporter permease subunit, partial [candidate division FCPU426 bacterium]|nr:efflux RND transporter permease subunit [candidate division FCPU426 bacterium]